VRTGAPGNPFLPEPRSTLSQRPSLDEIRGPTPKPVDTIARRQGLIGPGQSLGDGYRLTPQEHLMLAQAPKWAGQIEPGTTVRVRSYDIPGLPGPSEHMYVEYDDGHEQLIARGGPSRDGASLAGAALQDDLHVVGGVTPARLSRDYGHGQRVVFEGFAPGISAQQAADPARERARGLAADPRRYGWRSNSNSYAADAVEPLFGVRPGDGLTPGSRTRLQDAPRTSPGYSTFGNILRNSR
jgi:hypothetical protein